VRSDRGGIVPGPGMTGRLPEAPTAPSVRADPTGPEPVSEAGTAAQLERFSALDGIRAFAVMAVLCFHAGVSWVGGGLLGVDVFFVLS
jgi:hypothetical protein